MENLISKELLREVLNKKVVEICNTYDTLINDNFIDTERELAFKYKSNNASILNDTINIYELAHKCKEWALNKGYTLLTKNKECLIYSVEEVYDVVECLNQYEEYFEADTEYEAIFKACEWIKKELANG